MVNHEDREGVVLEKGDRVRVVKSSEWVYVEGKRQRLVGQYAYVTDTQSSQMTVELRLEEDPTVERKLTPDTVSLAPGMVEPEIEEPQRATSSHDVELIERYPRHGRAEYSVYRIGEDEGTATLLHNTMTWELTFAEVSMQEYDGGKADKYDDSPSGAWSVWNRMRAGF